MAERVGLFAAGRPLIPASLGTDLAVVSHPLAGQLFADTARTYASSVWSS